MWVWASALRARHTRSQWERGWERRPYNRGRRYGAMRNPGPMSDSGDPICRIPTLAVVRRIEKLNAVAGCCTDGQEARGIGRPGLVGHRGPVLDSGLRRMWGAQGRDRGRPLTANLGPRALPARHPPGAEPLIGHPRVSRWARHRLCRSEIRTGAVSCGDGVRSGGAVVVVDQAAEDWSLLYPVRLEVGDGGRVGWFVAGRGSCARDWWGRCSL